MSDELREKVALAIEDWLVDGDEDYIPAKPDADTYKLTNIVIALCNGRGLRERVIQDIVNFCDATCSTADTDECEVLADRILVLLRPEPGLREAVGKYLRAFQHGDLIDRQRTMGEMKDAYYGDGCKATTERAALSAPRDEPKPTDIAGDHTGMHWDGLAGVWRRDVAPRDESKEGGR
jgi:hypothetical protein